MPLQDPQTPASPEVQPPSPDIRNGLEQLKEKVPEKPSILGFIQNIKDYFAKLDPAKKKQIASIVGAAIFGLLFAGKEEDAEKKDKADEAKKTSAKDSANEKEESENEDEENEDELSARERRRKVVCDDARLICINTDPAKNKRPDYLAGKSSYLLEYGLPDYRTFKEEMIGILAPNAENEEEGLEKVMDVLKRSPMGKYQCMPQYLFQYIKFPFEGEEGLKAMWKFLQNEDLQRKACEGYVKAMVASLRRDPRFNGDPRYVYAAYYGGPSAGKALLAADTNTASEEEKNRVTKKQGAYISIDEYAGKKGGSVNIDAIVNGIAGRESGSLEGKVSKPRDEEWEQDQRYAYNRQEQNDENEAIA
ncbi:MAG: hypothetical protein V1880_00735 [Patescibacteria group bacterium]